MTQKIINRKLSIEEIDAVLLNLKSNKVLIVHDSSFPFLSFREKIESIGIPFVTFSEFTSNPLYEDVIKGVSLFQKESCDTIIAVGGGSSIDVAKSIKLFCKMDSSKNYLKQDFVDSGVPIIAIPTTAGTGSESTRYAVIYYDGKKQSVTHDSIIPNYAMLDSTVLKSLPLYQKKCTMLDALCQAIESWWSVNSNEASQLLSKNAVRLILDNYKSYINDNDSVAAEKIMTASNLAGQAICITQTTAAHAMSYKLTSMYKMPHGHAVAVCLPSVWNYMISHLEECIDPRGINYLNTIFSQIATELGADNPNVAVSFFNSLLYELGISCPKLNAQEDLDVLAESVNPIRLSNNPVRLSKNALYTLYTQIVK